MLIEVDIVNGCLNEEILTTFNQKMIIYQAGKTGEVTVSPTWEES